MFELMVGGEISYALQIGKSTDASIFIGKNMLQKSDIVFNFEKAY